MSFLGKWWHETEDKKFQCDLCPRACRLRPNQRGFCFVRQAKEDGIYLETYGRSSGFCIDPIEKKPLNHFYPGTPVLSFGTAGCNLGCKFCQNWDISKSKEFDRLTEKASPEQIADLAVETGSKSIAFTYNDPVIFAEYAIDCAHACLEKGVHPVAVTAGYISSQARHDFFRPMSAANIDLKAFTEEFYWKLSIAHLKPVLETLEFLKESSVWFEITTLLIPGANDDHREIEELCLWILNHLGPEVPLHFTAFHPDFKLKDRGPTPPKTVVNAREIALKNGLHYVYTGNIVDPVGSSTFCSACKTELIARSGYQLENYQIKNQSCKNCQKKIPGRFEDIPGNWGNKRIPLSLSS